MLVHRETPCVHKGQGDGWEEDGFFTGSVINQFLSGAVRENPIENLMAASRGEEFVKKGQMATHLPCHFLSQ